jgi:hypothetical protein
MTRSGRRIRTSTLDAYRTAVVYLNEKIGDKNLAAFDNAEASTSSADFGSPSYK